MKPVIIIAEAGVNHNGDLSLAKKLIEAASDSGADYVKFQTFKAENLVTRSAQKAAYQVNNMNDGDNSQFQMLKNTGKTSCLISICNTDVHYICLLRILYIGFGYYNDTTGDNRIQ